MAVIEQPIVGISALEYNNRVPPQVYTEEFRSVIEAHVLYLTQHSETREYALTDHLEYIKQYDFDGLLFALNIPAICYFATLRMNNLDSQNQDLSKLETIMVPSEQEIMRILQNEITKTRR